MKRENAASAMKKEDCKSERGKVIRSLRGSVPSHKRARKENPDNPALKCRGTVSWKCGRITQADMFVDVSDLDESVRGDSIFVCDACVERLRRTGVML